MPHNFPRSCFKTKNLAPSIQGKNAIAICRWSAGGPAVKVFIAQFRRVTVFPNFLPGPRVQAEDGILLIGIAHGEGAPLSYGNRRVPGAHRCFPKDSRPFRGPFSRPPFFRGNSIAVRAAPMRPVRRVGQGRRKQRGRQHRNSCCPGCVLKCTHGFVCLCRPTLRIRPEN